VCSKRVGKLWDIATITSSLTDSSVAFLRFCLGFNVTNME